MKALLMLVLASCDAPPGAMQNIGTDGGPCDNFAEWREIPAPFEGERCFSWESSTRDQSGVVCKRSDSVFLKACADPKRRPDLTTPPGTPP